MEGYAGMAPAHATPNILGSIVRHACCKTHVQILVARMAAPAIAGTALAHPYTKGPIARTKYAISLLGHGATFIPLP